MEEPTATTVRKGEASSDTDVDGLDDLDVGTALMAALSTRDMGEPSVELNLSTLTPTERRAILKLLQHQLELGEAVRQVTRHKDVPTAEEEAAP